jgi:hypothetical protein
MTKGKYTCEIAEALEKERRETKRLQGELRRANEECDRLREALQPFPTYPDDYAGVKPEAGNICPAPGCGMLYGTGRYCAACRNVRFVAEIKRLRYELERARLRALRTGGVVDAHGFYR